MCCSGGGDQLTGLTAGAHGASCASNREMGGGDVGGGHQEAKRSRIHCSSSVNVQSSSLPHSASVTGLQHLPSLP